MCPEYLNSFITAFPKKNKNKFHGIYNYIPQQTAKQKKSFSSRRIEMLMKKPSTESTQKHSHILHRITTISLRKKKPFIRQ